MSLPTAPIVAAGIIGGYAAGRVTKIRPLGGAVLAAAGAAAGKQWAQDAGPTGAAVLSAIYTSAFGLSHPLAKKIGPWPSVFVAAGASAAAAWLISDRKRAQPVTA
jgi:hypothetical protein